MRILRFANGIYPEVVGGIEVNVARISEHQAKLGHDVEVHVPKPTGASPAHPAGSRGYRVHFYDPRPVVIGNPLSFHPRRVLKEKWDSTDVVHTHSHLYFGSNLAAYTARGRKAFVLTNEGMYSQTAPMFVQKVFMRTAARYTFKNASAILTYSKAERDEMLQFGADPEKIHIVTQGIDLGRFSPRPKRADGFHLLWVGRHVPGKGVDLLLDATRLLRREGMPVRVTFVGSGPTRDASARRAKQLGIEDAVSFRGFVTECELDELYATSHAFVLPSVSEAMNRCVLESLASGTVAVTSDLPHLRELLDGVGAVTPARTPDALAGTLRKLGSTDVTAAGRRGRERVLSRFSWHRALSEVDAVFESVARA